MTTYSTIDDLPAGTPSGTDNLEVSQGGVSRRVTFAQVGSGAVLPFLPTAGGTLTGNLAGTTAAFSGEITAANPALGDNDTTVATTRWVKDQAYAGASGFLPIGGGTLTGNLAGTTAAFSGNVTFPTQTPGTNNTTGATTAYVTAAVAASPAGSVTTVSVTPANGLAGTVANPTTAPAITLSTSITGVLKGNGTAISAAVSGGDYLAPNNPTFTGTMTGGAYAGTAATLSAAPAYPNNTTSVATTAFVTAGIAAVSGGGPFLPTAGGTLSGPLTGTATTMSGTVEGKQLTVKSSAAAVIELNDTDTAVKKFLTNDQGTFNIVNSAFSTNLFSVTDAGVATFTGGLTGTTATFNAGATTPAFRATGNDAVLLGLFNGATKGVRITTDASQVKIEGVDNTGVGSFQPLTLGGSIVQVSVPLSGTSAVFSGTVNAPGAQIQMVFVETGTIASGTTLIPFDNTIPQITEGDQYMTLAITPKSATSKLIIEVTAVIYSSVANNMGVALFQDATANALAAAHQTIVAANTVATVSFRHIMTSGTTSATTFRVRAGGAIAGTTNFNGNAGTQIYGGVAASSIVICEVA